MHLCKQTLTPWKISSNFLVKCFGLSSDLWRVYSWQIFSQFSWNLEIMWEIFWTLKVCPRFSILSLLSWDYSVYTENFARKHYFKVEKIILKIRRHQSTNPRQTFFSSICADHVLIKRKCVDCNVSSNKLILKNVTAWMTKFPCCSIAKIMKINYTSEINVYLALRKCILFTGLAWIIIILS